MHRQITLRVNMDLLSDAIFGSGYSVPGGEDIAVNRDERGYPYLRGSTFKGLLRESLENLLVWTGGEETDLAALLGESGWTGADDGRRIHLTALTLSEKPVDPESCFYLRMFTSMENGVAADGTLHTASCIHSGLTFTGEVTCQAEDAALVKSALAGIKWVGTMRSRGFGRVRVRGIEVKAEPAAPEIGTASCICYRLRTETPVVITDLDRSQENSYETRGYIPGSAVRGMVISTLASRYPDWFQKNRAALLSEDTRFLNAVPVVDAGAPIPAIKGFYEDKGETVFETVVRAGTFTAGLKRAKLGAFCALDGDTVCCWSAATSGTTRISLNTASGENMAIFQSAGICAGQELEGYILLENPDLANEIARALSDTVWLGADRYEGFGKCSVTNCRAVERPDWISAYGYRSQDEIGTELYLLAVSPLTMLNEVGDPCGLDLETLAEQLGVSSVEIRFCSTSLAEFGGYNRTWKCRASAVRMYDQGSVFHLACDKAPSFEKLQSLQWQGMGIRRAEGFGQILFLRPELFEGLCRKRHIQRERSSSEREAAALRRKKYEWVMDHSGEIESGELSTNQVNTIQALFKKAIAQGGRLTELETYLEKNLTGRGVRHGKRFRKVGALIQSVLDTPLDQTLGLEDTPCADSVSERLRLLCLLFDFSRKG